jgi:hypothetical protein
MAHFDDGCLYAPDYLGRMIQELPAKGTDSPAAVALARWYYLNIQEKLFRLVDLRRKDPLWEEFGNPKDAVATDQWQHGFTFVYTRRAWEQYPFTDKETVGTGSHDFGFMNALRKAQVSAKLVNAAAGAGPGDALAAKGWHRDAVGGGKDTSASINASLVLEFVMFRGEELRNTPKTFKKLMPALNELSSALYDKRERYLKELVSEHGSVYVCSYCNFALALSNTLSDETKTYARSMQEIDADTMMKTFDRVPMKFDICMFSKAGGCMAEGRAHPIPPGHSFLAGWQERMANCRNCGSQLGWRYEPIDGKTENLPTKEGGMWQLVDKDTGYYVKVGQQERENLVPAEGPLMWGLIGRHLRLRKRPGEMVPSEFDGDSSRHSETNFNRGKNDVCPTGHKLRRFPCGQGNGACRPHHYICDLCDRPAKAKWHMWGCGSCDYDMCEDCYSNRRKQPQIQGW